MKVSVHNLMCALAVVSLSAQTLPEGAANRLIFEQQMLPVFQKHCAGCHSSTNPGGGLALASLETLLAGGKHGSAVAPGAAAQSLLMKYVRGEASPKMPLGGSLDADVITALDRAVDSMKALPKSINVNEGYLGWLLKKPVAPKVPTVKDSGWVGNPVDAFILAKLEAKGMKPAAPASKRALLRRAYFDVIGLPPTPEDVAAFEADESPEAFEKVIDKLLADSRYGERWARHWLDLARFAESDGFAIDGERPTAWRYRDYVIRAFNQDRPYNVFVEEQLAGDEMTGGNRSEHLVALGFLRMGTWEADANFKTQLRQDVLNELTGTVGQVFLGFTVGCARCHDHKYDPIPQKDFYRLQAFFAPMRVEDRAAPFLDTERPKLMKAQLRRFEDDSEVAAQAFKKLEGELKLKYAEAKQISVDDKKAGEFQAALKNLKDATYSEEERSKWRGSRDHARRLEESMGRYRPVAYSVSDVAPPHVPELAATYLLHGGELTGRGEKVEPGFPQGVEGKSVAAKIPFAGGSSGRRTALAEWIGSGENPLTARVMVNRIWAHHFGEGIVRTVSDFGINGERPTHPELLDFLATQFVEKKWSMKAMHKLMMLSNTYRQSTANAADKEFAELDPRNSLLWRMNWTRLEGETIRDSVMSVSGRLQKSEGGPGVFVSVPSDVAEGFEFFKWYPSPEKDQAQRTIYTFQRRSVMNPMIEVFDGANMSEVCSRRSSTVVATQAFALLNSDFTRQEASHFAKRVIELAGTDREKQLDQAFLLALSRKPSVAEREAYAASARGASPVEALTRLGVVLFNLNEFIYLE